MSIIIRTMSEKELIQCRHYFWNQDQNNDGQLSWGEFNKMCNTIGLRLSERQMKKAFTGADINNNGFITFLEFVSAYFANDGYANITDSSEPIGEMSKNKLTAIRDCFYDKQKHHNGKMTRLDFLRMVKTLGIIMNNNEINKVFDIAEGDKDGKISFEEFKSNFLKDKSESISKVTSKELAKIRECFIDVDGNGDGKLNRNEFLRMMQGVGIDLDIRQLNNVYRKADKDGDGTVTFEEFSEAYMGRSHETKSGRGSKMEKTQLSSIPPEKLAEIRKYFSDHDKNRDGRLSWDEFLKMIKDVGLKLQERALTKAFSVADHNRDGSISFAEFIQIYSNAEEFSESGIERRKMSEREVIECCKHFWSADKDCDGKLSPTEFLKMLETLGMTLNKRELNRAFRIADVDGDGMISFNEFAKAYLNKDKTKCLSADQIKEIFYKFDNDNNGFLSQKECLRALKMLGNTMDDKRLERMIKGMDKNHDGRITLNEFCIFLDVPE